MCRWLEGPSYQKVANIPENEIVLAPDGYSVSSKLADFEIGSDEEDGDRPGTVSEGHARF